MATRVASAPTTPRAQAKAPAKAPAKKVAKVESVEVTLGLDHPTAKTLVFGVDWTKNPDAPVRTVYVSKETAESLSLAEGDSIILTIRKA